MKTIDYKITTLTTVLATTLLAGCATHLCCQQAQCHSGQDRAEYFGTTQDGTPVSVYTLRNKNGVEARILTYGGILQSLKVPDKNGRLGDVVLGYDNLAGYLTNSPYFGALIGRYGNRIAKGHSTLDGVTYTLAPNNVPNSLHGGVKSFDKVVWHAKPGISAQGETLKLTYISHDGEEGYPGNLKVTALYTLTEDNAIRLDYTATSDRDTVANLTQHSYFNLAGRGDILGHVVYLNADKFTPVDNTLIPTGELKPVDGTPFDFRTPTAIGARIGQDDEQLKFGKGYDHNWVINHPMGELGLDARVAEPTTGRVLEVWSTNRPAILLRQFPRRHDHRQGRPRVSVPQRLLHGTAALPGFAESRQLPAGRAASRRSLSQHDYLQIFYPLAWNMALGAIVDQWDCI